MTQEDWTRTAPIGPALFMMSMWRDLTVTAMQTHSRNLETIAKMMSAYSLAGARIELPFSGDVNQIIDPDTNWGIIGNAGSHQTERAIVDGVASYGRQLGWMMDLLLDVSGRVDGVDEEKLDRIRELRRRVEEMKSEIERVQNQRP